MSFLQDLRIGLRVLLKEKSFFAISVLVLALGIGGVTAQFSVINSALIRGLPFAEPDQLVRVLVRDPSWAPGRTRMLFARDLLNWSATQQSFVGLSGYFTQGSFIVTTQDVPQRFPGSHVIGPLFSLIGVKPALGRDFTEDDNRPDVPRVTIISDAFWKSEFARDPAILGRTLRLNGQTATVIGVMPPGFSFPREQLWMPMFNEYPRGPAADWVGGTVHVLGRLKPGIAIDQATAELATFARHAEQEFPRSNQGLTEVVVEPLLNTFVTRDARQLMWVMLGAVAAVLLIACLNVMNMQFARATLRARELAVRGALGATRFRLMAQMLTESLLVAGSGGAVGVLFSTWAIDLYGSSAGTGLPAWIRFEIDPTVLLFTLVVTGGTVMVSGLLPAFIASRTDALDVLKAGGRGHTHPIVNRIAGGLVVGQIALTATLLVVSLLLVKSVTSRYALDFGYDTESVLAGRMNFEATYKTEESNRLVQRRLLDHLRASPRFANAAFSSRRNSLLTAESRQVFGDSPDQPRIEAFAEFVSDGYFATLGLRPLEGREFEPADTPEKPMPALVNATFARKFFRGASALGRQIRVGSERSPACTIVGVVPDTLMQGPMDARNDGAGIFLPSTVITQAYLTLVVRGRSASPAQLVEPLRREILKVDPNLAIYVVETPRSALTTMLTQVRVVTRLFAMFGIVAMLLAAVGLYGVAAFSVSQRTQEFGIRMALGAEPRQIMEMILRQGALRLMLGGLLGLALAFALARLGSTIGAGLLYKVNPRDPAIYALVLALLAVATLIACFVPARRATKVDPMAALRTE